jgi:hypothetical protein
MTPRKWSGSGFTILWHAKIAVSRYASTLALLLFLTNSYAFGALGFPDCPAAHCSGNNADINMACIAAGLAGKPFPLMSADGSVCTCACSCVTADTEILLPSLQSARIDALRPKHSLFVPYSETSAATIEQMLMSEVEKSTIHRITFDNGKQLLASPNHTLVKNDGLINNIANIPVGTGILTGNHGTTKIISNEVITGFTGQLWNLVIAGKSPKPFDHIVLTNGIQSGDFLLQSSHDRIEREIDLRLGIVEPIQFEQQK